MGHRKRPSNISRESPQSLRQRRRQMHPLRAHTQSSDPAAKLDPAKDAAIRHLMEITEVSNMGQNIQNYITEQVQQVAGRAVGAGKVQKFMDTFSTQFNASASPGAVTDAMVTIYAKNFSMEDIQGLIQFYETPLGKRVVKTLPEVSQESQRMGVEMEQNAAIIVLRGMSNEYPEIKPMLPADDAKPAGKRAGTECGTCSEACARAGNASYSQTSPAEVGIQGAKVRRRQCLIFSRSGEAA